MPESTKLHTLYKLADGTRVPSVTTYLGVLNKPALMHWAWEQGVAGLDYRKVRDESSMTGTLVHYLIMCRLKGIEPDLTEYTQEDIMTSTVPIDKFNEWHGYHKVEPLILESPMVSEAYRFGGTPDFYGKIDGRLTLVDFKTSGAIYPENFYQLAAYKVLLEEAKHKVDRALVLRIGKDTKDGYEERIMGKLDACWEIFLACQKIYELQKETKRK